MTGSVRARKDLSGGTRLYPELKLSVRIKIKGQTSSLSVVEQGSFILDTGFNGFLALPTEFLKESVFSEIKRHTVREQVDGLNGPELLQRVTVGVQWDGKFVEGIAYLLESNKLLIGMELMEGHQVSIQAFDGGLVSVTPI